MKLSRIISMIPAEIERASVSRLNSFLRRRPSSAPFLSGDTFRALADYVHDCTGDMDPAAVSAGSVVFVAATRLREFADVVLPRICEPFVLITHQGDTNIDATFADVAEHPKVSRWFAQNCLLEHPKVTPLPIGLEDRWRHNNGAYRAFKRYSDKKIIKKPRIAFAFSIGTNVERRLACYRAMSYCQAADELVQPLNSSIYRKLSREYMFIASPPGNGLDCHRTWEAMYMGCVPIVERSYMTEYFFNHDLPLLLVDDWEEVVAWDEDELRLKYDHVMAKSSKDALYFNYWEKTILEDRA